MADAAGPGGAGAAGMVTAVTATPGGGARLPPPPAPTATATPTPTPAGSARASTTGTPAAKKGGKKGKAGATAAAATGAAAAAAGGKGAGSAPAPTKKSKRKKKAVAEPEDEGAQVPRTALQMQSLLKVMGVTDANPQVILQLMEFSHRYIHDVLQDAQCYAEHRMTSNHEMVTLTKEDVRLAVQSRVDFSCAGPPPREFLLEVSKEKNAVPLPSISTDKFGVRLPKDTRCLVNPNYAVLPTKKRKVQPTGPWDLPPSEDAKLAAAAARDNRKRRKLAEKTAAQTTFVQASTADTDVGTQIGAAAVQPEPADANDDDFD